jgi:hypothetical protein
MASSTPAPAKESNGSRAGTAILALLEAAPDGLTRKELEQKGATRIPRNKAGFYIREGVELLNSNGHEVIREGKTYKLQS